MGELSTVFFPPRSHRIKGLEIKHFDGGFFLSSQVNRGCDPFDCQEWEILGFGDVWCGDGNWDACLAEFPLLCHFKSLCLVIRTGEFFLKFILPQEDAASWKQRWQLVCIEYLSTVLDRVMLFGIISRACLHP